MAAWCAFDIELGRAALALLDTLNQANALSPVQLGQQLHGFVPPAAHILAYLVYGIVDINTPAIVIPIVFCRQAHALQQHTIEQFSIRGNVLELLIRDQQAGNFEVDKFF